MSWMNIQMDELHGIDIHDNNCCENIVLNIYTFCIWLSALSHCCVFNEINNLISIEPWVVCQLHNLVFFVTTLPIKEKG